MSELIAQFNAYGVINCVTNKRERSDMAKSKTHVLTFLKKTRSLLQPYFVTYMVSKIMKSVSMAIELVERTAN